MRLPSLTWKRRVPAVAVQDAATLAATVPVVLVMPVAVTPTAVPPVIEVTVRLPAAVCASVTVPTVTAAPPALPCWRVIAAAGVKVGAVFAVIVMLAEDTPAGDAKACSRTRMRACVVAVLGTVQTLEPVLGTLLAITVGNVPPPSVDSSIVTLRLKPPLLVQVMVAGEPNVRMPPLGWTPVIESAVPLPSLSGNHPMSRICWRVRSRSSDNPTLMNGSINRLGDAVMFQCDTDEPPWYGLGVKSSTPPPTGSRAAVRKLEAMRTLGPTHSRFPGVVADVARCAGVISAQLRPRERSNWKRAQMSGMPPAKEPSWAVKDCEPKPWPSSCSTTTSRLVVPAGVALSSP